MKTTFNLFCLLFCVAFIFSNCTKDDPAPTSHCSDNLEGTWNLSTMTCLDSSGAVIDMIALAAVVSGLDSLVQTWTFSKNVTANFDGDASLFLYQGNSTNGQFQTISEDFHYNVIGDCDSLTLSPKDTVNTQTNTLAILTLSSSTFQYTVQDSLLGPVTLTMTK